MFYTIYKTTNLVNNKVYIGKHQTNNINDGYLGSGNLLKKAIKKYGKDSFIKEILYVFNTEDEMNDMEKNIVNESFIDLDFSYNITCGGQGGPIFKNKKHTEESKKKISDSKIGKSVSNQTKEKISKKLKGRKLSN